MEQKTYWNNAAAIKEFTTHFQMDIFKKYVCKNAKILNVGCDSTKNVVNSVNR